MRQIKMVLLFFVTALTSVFSYAQKSTIIGSSKLVCIYADIINTKDKELKPVTDSLQCVLLIGDDCSKFFDYHDFVDEMRMNKVQIPSQFDNVDKNAYNSLCTVFQNYPKGKMTVREPIYPSYYVYEEPMNNLSWALKDDTATVCGYLCKSAVTTYGGRKWTAWYTEDIPSSSGPWKFNNLPGLILKAEDDSHSHRFEAFSLFQQTMDIRHIPSAVDQNISRNKFISYRNKIKTDIKNLDDPLYFIPKNAIKNRYISGMAQNKPRIFVNDGFVEIDDTGHYYIPLELK